MGPSKVIFIGVYLLPNGSASEITSHFFRSRSIVRALLTELLSHSKLWPSVAAFRLIGEIFEEPSLIYDYDQVQYLSGYLFDCVWCAACDGRCPAEIAQTTNNSFVFNFEQMLERGARVNVSEASHCFVLSPAFWPIFMTANKFVVILARVSLQM